MAVTVNGVPLDVFVQRNEPALHRGNVLRKEAMREWHLANAAPESMGGMQSGVNTRNGTHREDKHKRRLGF